MSGKHFWLFVIILVLTILVIGSVFFTGFFEREDRRQNQIIVLEQQNLNSKTLSACCFPDVVEKTYEGSFEKNAEVMGP